MKIEIEIPDEEIEAYNKNRPVMVDDLTEYDLRAIGKHSINKFLSEKMIEANKSKYSRLIRNLEAFLHTVEVGPDYIGLLSGCIIPLPLQDAMYKEDKIFVRSDSGKEITFHKGGGVEVTHN